MMLGPDLPYPTNRPFRMLKNESEAFKAMSLVMRNLRAPIIDKKMLSCLIPISLSVDCHNECFVQFQYRHIKSEPTSEKTSCDIAINRRPGITDAWIWSHALSGSFYFRE